MSLDRGGPEVRVARSSAILVAISIAPRYIRPHTAGTSGVTRRGR